LFNKSLLSLIAGKIGVFLSKNVEMKNKILKVGFDIIQDNIKNENIRDHLMVFDNFTDPIKDFELMSLDNGPIRVNTTIVAFCTDGFVKFTLGVKPCTMSKNMITLIRPEQILETTEMSSDFKVGFIILKRNFIEVRHNYTSVVTLHNFFMEQSTFHLEENSMEEYLVIYQLIKKKMEEKNNIYLLNIVQNLCQIMFYNLCNIHYHNRRHEGNEKKNNAHEIYKRFIQCVEMNYRSEHSVQYYANALCLTPKYLSKIVFQVSDRHAATWIQEFIILEAKALLKSTNMTIQQISGELNFPSQSFFGRYFKRLTGVSPKEYRMM